MPKYSMKHVYAIDAIATQGSQTMRDKQVPAIIELGFELLLSLLLSSKWKFQC